MKTIFHQNAIRYEGEKLRRNSRFFGFYFVFLKYVFLYHINVSVSLDESSKSLFSEPESLYSFSFQFK